MTGHRLGKCIVLCLLPWSCLSFAWSDAAGPGTATLGAGHVRKGLPRDAANGTEVQSNISGTEMSDRAPSCACVGCLGPSERAQGCAAEAAGASLVGHRGSPRACVGATRICVVATAASVIWERCVASEAVRRHGEETCELMFSFESEVLLRVNIHAIMMDLLSAGHGCTEHIPSPRG